MITTFPEGTNFSVVAVVSADRRYVRVTPSPTFSQITDVQTFSFTGGGAGTNTGTTAAGNNQGGNVGQNQGGNVGVNVGS